MEASHRPPFDVELRMNTAEIGSFGERCALQHLSKQEHDAFVAELSLRSGEVDLIAYDETALVFIEVKMRSSSTLESPAEALRPDQEGRIRWVPQTSRCSRKLEDLSFRFDVVSVETIVGEKPR